MLGVGVAIRFAPSEVGQAEYQCLEEVPSPLGAGSATICFTIHKSSPDQLGEFPPGGPVPQPPRPPALSSGQGGPEAKSHFIPTSARGGNLGPFSPPLPRPGQMSVSSISLESADLSPPASHCLPRGHPLPTGLGALPLSVLAPSHPPPRVISPKMQTWPPHVPA